MNVEDMRPEQPLATTLGGLRSGIYHTLHDDFNHLLTDEQKHQIVDHVVHNMLEWKCVEIVPSITGNMTVHRS